MSVHCTGTQYMVVVTGHCDKMLPEAHMPKGVQEKRTEVLENKVDRM